MRELRFTIYEVLGYLFPGAVVFAAILIVLWGLKWHNFQLDNLNQASRRELAVIAVVVYLLGHLAQAIANWTDRLTEKLLRANSDGVAAKIVRGLKWAFLEKGVEQTKQGLLAERIMDRVRDQASDYYRLERSSLDDMVLNQLCDAAVVMSGAPEEREIYIYREGFYRGIWLGLILVALAFLFPLFAKLAGCNISVTTAGQTFKPSCPTLGLLAVASWVCSCFAYGRYWRFRNYRVEGAFLFFLSAAKKKPS